MAEQSLERRGLHPRVDLILYHSFLPLQRQAKAWLQVLNCHTLGDGKTIQNYAGMLKDTGNRTSPYQGAIDWEPHLLQAGVLARAGDTVHLESPDIPAELLQALIVAKIRATALDGVNATTIARELQNIQEQGRSRAVFPLTITPDTAQVAELLGICEVTEDVDSGQYMITSTQRSASQLPTDRTQLEFLVFMIRALHDSTSLPGMSTGWNHLLVLGGSITNDIDFEKQSAWGPLDYVTLARAGYLVPATSFKNSDRDKRPFFLQVEPQQGRALRRTDRYKRWLKDSQYYVVIAADWLAKFVLTEAAAVQPLAPTVFLVSANLLQQRLPAGLLIENLFYHGFARRADNRGHRSDKDGNLYISTDPSVLEQWMDSEQRAARENPIATKLPLAVTWQERLRPLCTRRAEYIPTQFQPAFLFHETAIQPVAGETLSFSQLTVLGYCVFQYRVQKDQSAWYAYFSDPAQGRAFRQYTESHSDFHPGLEMIHWLAKQLREQVRTSCRQQVTIPERGNCCRIRYTELEALVKEFPPLNINSLKRNGFVIDGVGQNNKTSRTFGMFLVPLD